ncbi:MAG: acetyl/propionyl/methylcrotonyl-CoA carboxylase subunit alpha [Gemmatimonadota bacterium]
MFDTVLIANRGEIAVRVIRACREERLRTVAVFTEPDRKAPHVLAADFAVSIAPADAAGSYLDVERLLEVAGAYGAGAIHPGYGFLAENAEFARRVEAAGLVFIGPPADAIDAMGDKTRARELMIAAGVPVVPGSDTVATSAEALAAAEDIGYPVMIKAAAGGGGKGMRVAADSGELLAGYERAVSEATQAFGDGRVYLERFMENPRHIEIQVLADADRVVHLGERECSIQRRHQKLIEEAPCIAITTETRTAMGDVAVRAAAAVSYLGAGTVEFLYQDGEFFFLEMNTRIQVEHPVTELVTGVDLVREQLRIAAGGLALDGAPVPTSRGHAIECRISAEDPTNGFFPSTGVITAIDVPAGGGVRWDAGVREGSEVGLHYDPLLAKLIVHAEDRPRAIERMRVALAELRVEGISTTASFHRAAMDEPDFRAGEFSIRYVDEHPDLVAVADGPDRDIAVAAAVFFEEETVPAAGGAVPPGSVAEEGGSRGITAWVRAVRD